MRPYVWASALSIAAIFIASFVVGLASASLLAAAWLTVVVGIAHSALGEQYIVQPVLRLQGLPVVLGDEGRTKAIIRYAWHLLSLTWWGIAAMMVYMAVAPGPLDAPFLWMAVVVFGLSGAIVLIGSRGVHLAWVFFFAIAALSAHAALQIN
jgi:hypothetical protein